MLPGWFRWVFLLVMAYVIYSASQMQQSSVVVAGNSKPILPAITPENYPSLAEATDVERWKRSLNPDYAATMNCSLDAPKAKGAMRLIVSEQVEGTGAGAQCGENVTIELVVWDAAGARAYGGDVTLALGSRELSAGLDYGLAGIRVGERTLVLPPYALARGAKPSDVKAALKALPEGKVAVVSAKRVK